MWKELEGSTGMEHHLMPGACKCSREAQKVGVCWKGEDRSQWACFKQMGCLQEGANCFSYAAQSE